MSSVKFLQSQINNAKRMIEHENKNFNNFYCEMLDKPSICNVGFLAEKTGKGKSLTAFLFLKFLRNIDPLSVDYSVIVSNNTKNPDILTLPKTNVDHSKMDKFLKRFYKDNKYEHKIKDHTPITTACTSDINISPSEGRFNMNCYKHKFIVKKFTNKNIIVVPPALFDQWVTESNKVNYPIEQLERYNKDKFNKILSSDNDTFLCSYYFFKKYLNFDTYHFKRLIFDELDSNMISDVNCSANFAWIISASPTMKTIELFKDKEFSTTRPKKLNLGKDGSLKFHIDENPIYEDMNYNCKTYRTLTKFKTQIKPIEPKDSVLVRIKDLYDETKIYDKGSIVEFFVITYNKCFFLSDPSEDEEEKLMEYKDIKVNIILNADGNLAKNTIVYDYIKTNYNYSLNIENKGELVNFNIKQTKVIMYTFFNYCSLLDFYDLCDQHQGTISYDRVFDCEECKYSKKEPATVDPELKKFIDKIDKITILSDIYKVNLIRSYIDNVVITSPSVIKFIDYMDLLIKTNSNIVKEINEDEYDDGNCCDVCKDNISDLYECVKCSFLNCFSCLSQYKKLSCIVCKEPKTLLLNINENKFYLLNNNFLNGVLIDYTLTTYDKINLYKYSKELVEEEFKNYLEYTTKSCVSRKEKTILFLSRTGDNNSTNTGTAITQTFPRVKKDKETIKSYLLKYPFITKDTVLSGQLKQRNAQLKEFKESKDQFLLVLIGEDSFSGLNLQYCKNIIMEGNYNIQHTMQAIGRINRIGMDADLVPNIYITDHRIISDNDYKLSISEFLPLHEFNVKIFK